MFSILNEQGTDIDKFKNWSSDYWNGILKAKG